MHRIFHDIHKDALILALYLVPAFLYCLYNNLTFVNLSHFDPTTYYLLMQFRVVITGILFQVIFKKRLSLVQWVSLILLTCGCILKQIEFDWTFSLDVDVAKFLNVHIVFVLLQTFCSCFAGVYNEYLLKKENCTADIYVQNIYMYLDSIAFNLVAMFIVDSNPLAAFSTENISKLGDWRVLLIMVNSALIGIITSFFLKKYNSILKVFAGALELVGSAVISYFLFGISILANTILSIIIVSLAMIMYTIYPMKDNNTNQSGDSKAPHNERNGMDDNQINLVDVPKNGCKFPVVADVHECK